MRLSSFLILLLIATLVSSCNNSTEIIQPTESIQTERDLSNKIDRLCDKMGAPDQSTFPAYEWVNASDTNDVEEEFDNMHVWLEKETYMLNEVIKVHVKNNNEKPFGLFSVLFVERYSKEDKWQRLTYAPNEYYYASWGTCLGSSVLTYDPYYLVEKNEPGVYRFILLCGGKHIYSPEIEIK